MMRIQKKHSIDAVVVLVLFGVFAVSVLMVLIFAASAYNGIKENADINAEKRICAGYAAEKVRHYKYAGGIETGEFDGCDALILRGSADESGYITYIYYYDGRIRELFTVENSGMEAGAGENITAASGFRTERLAGGLLRIVCTAPDGRESIIAVSTAVS